MNLKFVFEMEYDAVVCGLGSAGFTAAVQCARLGLKTAAVEKYNMPGGVLTVLGNNSIDQFNNPFRPDKKLVITGIGWEYVNRLAATGDAVIPDMNAEYKKHSQYGVKVNPCAASSVMNEMLLEVGVALYLGQNTVDVMCEDGPDGRRVTGVVISTKSGPALLTAKVFIDCTGDGDICAYSGMKYSEGENGVLQPGTLRGFGGTSLELRCRSSDSDALTSDEIAARKAMSAAGGEWANTAPAIAPRESRRILCESVMNVDDYMSGRQYDDSVCYSFWFVDIHREGRPALIRYLKSAATPSIRLSAMIPAGSCNLLVAGRCVSSDRETNSAIRVKASCMAMGQAVGAAAYAAVRGGRAPRSVPADEVKDILERSGAVVPGRSDGEEYRVR